MEKLKPSLQLEDEIELHEKGWIAQRIGWLLMFILLVSTALGLFGNGWLSDETLAIGDSQITYERFGRFELPMQLTIRAQADQGGLTVSIPQSYLHCFNVSRITPEPSERKTVKGSIVYTFEGKDEIIAKFYLEPETTGTLRAGIRVNNSLFTPSHFIFP